MPAPLPPIPSLAAHRTKFVRPLQLARYTGIPIRTIYHHIEKGALVATRRGGVLVIRIEIAREYAAEPLPTPGTSPRVAHTAHPA